MAGVNPSTVTRVSETLIRSAVVGKRIDAAHPDAVEYLKNRERAMTPAAAPGLDPLYDEAVQFCAANNLFTAAGLARGIRVGPDRAKRILDTMRAAGLVPEKDAPKVKLTSEDAPPVIMDRSVATRLGLIGNKPRGQAAVREAKKQSGVTAPAAEDLPDDIREFADYTLRQLVDQFGTDVAFLDWLKATKAIEDIHEKRLKNAEKAGELISRTLVSEGLIATIDGAFTRMLTDGAKTIAVRAHSLVTTGADATAVEDLVSKQLTTFIRPTKSKLARVLSNA